MFTFIKQEWKFYLKSPMVWIFLLINSLLVFGAVSSDNVVIGGGVGNVFKNAPYVVQQYYGVFSLLCLLMTTAFMNGTANRDFECGMHQFVFSSPIKKRDYFFGKFIGAFTISLIPLLGVSLGALIGPLMPWVEAERYGPVIWNGHLRGFLSFGIPNTFIAGVLLYSLGIIFRSNIVSFIGAMLLLVLYAVSAGYTRDIEKQWLACILDPFGFRPLNIVARYMTVAEKNAGGVSLTGAFLYNRLLWMGISTLLLFLMYLRFSFSSRNEKSKKKETDEPETTHTNTGAVFVPAHAGGITPGMVWRLFVFELKAIIKNPTFIILVAIGMINLVASLITFSGGYGTKQYPVTYDMVSTIKGAFTLFLVAVITFYTGVLVWKERDAKINEIQDATPVKSGLLLSTKALALIVSIALVLIVAMFAGLITQLAFGYHRFQVDVYLKSLLVIDLLYYVYLVVISLFFHYVINNRYIAYFVFVVFLIVNLFVWSMLEINTNMLKYGSVPTDTYSDMNGYGPYVAGITWFNIYWILFCILIGFIVSLFYVRGKETEFSHRLGDARLKLGKSKWFMVLLLLAFIACGSFVFYNTQVLNKYDSPKQLENIQVEYEKNYKKYESLAQPRFYRYNYTIDLEPEKRNLFAHIVAWARNVSGEPISELHFTLPGLKDSLKISIAGSTLKKADDRLSYRIYTLDKPLQPGDSVLIKVDCRALTRGFENEVSFTQLTGNGTFFNNRDIMPMLGYQKDAELSDKNKRAKLKLPKRPRANSLDDNNLAARANNYVISDADWVDVTTTISTAPDQIAVAPGSLVRSWDAGGRKYYQYQLDRQSLDFYSFISARYQVARKKWKNIALEVYYIKEHEYNVPNMQKSMEKALDYYTTNFGPYYHKQCRIIEFPRYQSFAQAFPGTMPYSEGIGFILDLRKVDKDDIDQAFYVVAHEMGHQYWAHQLCGAAMQGSEMMSEGFAQYSSLMVMEKEYGKDKMKKFLSYEMDGYLSGRSQEFEAERPLMKTESQQYIHYQKASVVMYYLKEMIGEDKVNEALRSLIDSFAYRQPPYATSLAAVNAFKKVTPDSLQYIITDMFENITLFNNRMVEANYKKVGAEYEITLKTTSEKFRSDSLGKETTVPIADYVNIGIFAEGKSKKNLGKVLLMQRVKIDKKENTYTFRTKELPYQAGIDPYNYLIDRVPDDNVKTVSGD